MHLIFNELSEKPLAENIIEAEERIRLFIQTFNAAKEKGFEYIRFEDLSKIELTPDLSLPLWIANTTSSNNRILREFFWSSFIRKPYIPEEHEEQKDKYGNQYYFLKNNGDEIYCHGLAITYLYNTLGISFLSSKIWEEIEHTIIIKDEDEEVLKSEQVYQVARPEHLDNPLLKIIKRLFLIKNLSTIGDLEELYPNYSFEDSVFNEVLYWKNESTEIYERLHRLLTDIEDNPFTGGLGKTEALKHEQGLNSKRLTQVDRVVYSLKGGNISVFSCKGHYGDK
jgi:Txe/YoeB family toxin of toxin-antitoxin system